MKHLRQSTVQSAAVPRRQSNAQGRRFEQRPTGRAIVGVGLATAALAFGGCGDEPTGPNGRIIEVEVVDFSFRPDSVDARVGDTVRWIQRDATPHTATSSNPPPDQPGGFDEPLLEDGDAAEVALARSGVIAYFCRPHPFMTGTIVVAPAGGGS
jgi:plastocyanin